MKTPTYSVIVPIRNESESLPQLFDELSVALRGRRYEVIAVDDASTDGSLQILRQIGKNTPSLRIIHIPKHLGKWAALRTGLAAAKGPVIITMDADLQDDPRELPKLFTKLNQGFDIVSGWRNNRRDRYYKIALTKFANAIITLVTGHRFYDFSSAMKAYRKEALMELPQEGSLLRYSFLLAHKLGLRIVEVPVVHRPRLYGQSKFGIIKYIRILYDLILILLLFSGSGRISHRKS